MQCLACIAFEFLYEIYLKVIMSVYKFKESFTPLTVPLIKTTFICVSLSKTGKTAHAHICNGAAAAPALNFKINFSSTLYEKSVALNYNV